MKNKLPMIARLVLGLIYFVFGLNGLVPFLPMTPPPMPEAAMEFMKGMMAAPYFMVLLKLTEVICGLMLLSGFAAPLALIILAPITLQILLFHGVMTPGAENIVMPAVMLVAHLLAATGFWKLYKPLFSKG